MSSGNGYPAQDKDERTPNHQSQEPKKSIWRNALVGLLAAGAVLLSPASMPSSARAANNTNNHGEEKIGYKVIARKAENTADKTQKVRLVAYTPPPKYGDPLPPRKLTKIDLDISKIGVRYDRFMDKKFLRSSKLLKYSDAEEELMEIESLEDEFRWMRNIQTFYGVLAAVGGLFALKNAGQLWDQFIKAQEEREKEDELRLTGRFIDTRAKRLDEDEKLKKQSEKKKKASDDDPDGGDEKKDGPSASSGTDKPKKPAPESDPSVEPSGIDALDKLLGDDD